MTSTRTDRAALTRESITAFDRSDWDALRALFDPAIVYEETGSGRRIEGLDALIEGLQTWRSAFPDMAGDVRRVAVDGRRHHDGGALAGHPHRAPRHPVRRTAAERRHRRYLVEHVADRSGDVIVHERNHLDLLSMLVQLGALPTPVSL